MTAVRLFHFTSVLHWPAIEASGAIRPSDPNVTPTGGGAPPVVWLLDSPNVGDHEHGLYGKAHVGIEVDTSLAIKWTDWSWTALMEPDWRSALLSAAGGEDAADHWWLVPGSIKAARWVRAWEMASGRTLWERHDA